MDFSKVQDLNKTLKYTNIKGKNYITVNQRVLAFRELYPNGRITTEIVKLAPENNGAGNTVIVKAFVYDGEVLIATGHAFENPGKNTNINKFSALENCETSAVGRALGFLGIGATDSIATLEEIQEAGELGDSSTNYAQQLAGVGQITPEHLATIEKLYQGASRQKLLDYLQITSLDQMDDQKAVALLAKVAAQQKAKKGAKS